MKRRLITIHKWLGLSIGLFWLLQGLSGALLSFAHEAEDAVLARGAAGDKPMLSGLRDGLAKVQDEGAGRFVTVVATGGLGRQFYAHTETASGEARAVRIDTTSGEIVWRGSYGEIGSAMSPVRFLQLFHTELLAGPAGHLAVGITGIVLFLTIIIGGVIAWPRRGAWAMALRPPRFRYKPGPLYAWHKALGLWTGVLMLVVTLSGAVMVWLVDIQRITSTTIPRPALPASASPVAPATIPDIMRVIALSSAAFPDATLGVIDTPSAAAPYYRVRLRQPEETRRVFGTTTVYVDSSATTVLMRHDPVAAPLSMRLIDMIYSLHTGEIAKLPGRIVAMLGGVALAALVLTSFLLWLRKRPRRRA